MENTQSIIDSNKNKYLNKQSIIDNRQNNKLNQSIIDYHTERLRTQLHDQTIGEGMVALALTKLGEAQINSIANYAARKGDAPGKVFVKICSNEIKKNTPRTGELRWKKISASGQPEGLKRSSSPKVGRGRPG